MTDETKQLFDAPWTIKSDGEAYFSVWDKNDDCICDGILMFDNAKRLARLPELYDALDEATRRYCGIVRGYNHDPIKNGCPPDNGRTCASLCIAREWLELLRKVRDEK